MVNLLELFTYCLNLQTGNFSSPICKFRQLN